MMAKKAFTLGDTLADVLGSVSETGTEQIEYLPLENLISDERNFYSMAGTGGPLRCGSSPKKTRNTGRLCRASSRPPAAARSCRSFA